MNEGGIWYDLPALRALHEAVYNTGPMPRYHRDIMARHRAEWPILWKAIDQLLEVPCSTCRPSVDSPPAELKARILDRIQPRNPEA